MNAELLSLEMERLMWTAVLARAVRTGNERDAARARAKLRDIALEIAYLESQLTR